MKVRNVIDENGEEYIEISLSENEIEKLKNGEKLGTKFLFENDKINLKLVSKK